MEKKYDCGVIQDLLPSYQDGICSEESRYAVKEHLEECADCRKIADCLQNSRVEEQLLKEKNGVLMQHAKKEKIRTAKIGMITAGILLIPVIVCLICNLAVGHALDWFFIVLASLMVFASLTVVPMLKEKNRGMWTLGSFVVSLLLLLGVINIYLQGDWFFIAAVPSLFGLTVLFLPYVLYKSSLPGMLQNKKGLITMTVDTVFLYGLIFVCSFYSESPVYNRVGFGTTTWCAAFVWLAFLIVRYLKIPGLCRAGLVAVEAGVFMIFINWMVDWLIYGKGSGFLQWISRQNVTVDRMTVNMDLILDLILGIDCVVIGICLFFVGWRRRGISRS